MIRIDLIEDEIPLAEELKQELESLVPEAQINILNSVQEALDFTAENGQPDLYFSDIELTDGLSFSFFRRLELKTPVIFCTAYNHYALKAFENFGIGYILKPYNRADLAEALDRFRNLKSDNHQQVSKMIEETINQAQKNVGGSLLINKGETIVPVQKNSIRLIVLTNGMLKITTTDFSIYRMNEKLENIQEVMGDKYFRINRQALIHRQAVHSVEEYFNRRLVIHTPFKVDEQLIVSRTQVKAFMTWLSSV